MVRIWGRGVSLSILIAFSIDVWATGDIYNPARYKNAVCLTIKQNMNKRESPVEIQNLSWPSQDNKGWGSR